MNINVVLQYDALELLNGDNVGDLYTEVEKSLLSSAVDNPELANVISSISGVNIAYFDKTYPNNLLKDDSLWIHAMHLFEGEFDFNPNDLYVSGYEENGGRLVIEYTIPVVI